ncbi:MAG: polysaccharide deacetylase family protein [bacterium]
MKKRAKLNYLLIIIAAALIVMVFSVVTADRAFSPTSEVLNETSTPTPELENLEDLEGEEVKASVLMYHHIGGLLENADQIRIGLTVSTEEFESQIKYLSENDYQFMTLGELYKNVEKKKAPKKVAVLTFDDGYDDNFYEALPILKKYNARGTFFIISSKIGDSEYMSEDQVKELSKAGNEIGSHSVNHPSLERYGGDYLNKELVDSKNTLSDLTDKEVISFCYPAGKYNDKTIAAVSEAGYKIAVTTRSSTGLLLTSQLLEVPRYRISSDMSFEALFR